MIYKIFFVTISGAIVQFVVENYHFYKVHKLSLSYVPRVRLYKQVEEEQG